MATFWPATNPASFKPCSNAVTRCSEPAADVLRRNPITGTADCCARAVNGHATTVLLESLMNSRRLMASPAPRACIGCKKEYHKFRSRIVPFVAPERDRNHVRFTPKADIAGGGYYVRPYPLLPNAVLAIVSGEATEPIVARRAASLSSSSSQVLLTLRIHCRVLDYPCPNHHPGRDRNFASAATPSSCRWYRRSRQRKCADR